MEPAKISAVVFDMDGVLFDSEPLHIKAWQAELREDGHEYPAEFFSDWIGVPDKNLDKLLQSRHPRRDGRRHAERKHECFAEIVRRELKAYDGLVARLEALSARVRLALATSSRRSDRDLMLGVAGLGRFFAASCCNEDVERHKPHPDAYLYACALVQADPAESVAIEDSPSGVKAALAAGMTALAVRTSFGDAELAGAHHIFDRTIEACDWVLARLGGAKDEG